MNIRPNGIRAHNEDDTFNALKKATFEQMQHEFQTIADYYRSRVPLWDEIDYTGWVQARIDAAERGGWTVTEWQAENSRRLHNSK